MNIASWLMRTAQVSPDRPALYAGTDLVADYATFHNTALRVAGALAALGIVPGDRVAIFMPNGPDYLIIHYGIWYAGAVAVPINSKLHGREAAFILDNSGAQLVFADPSHAADLHAAKVKCTVCNTQEEPFPGMKAHPPLAEVTPRAPNDLAWLFYTSGTTGQPKGVMITHRMLLSVSLSYSGDVDTVRDEDHAIYAAPLSHGAGLYNMVHVRTGAGHVFPLSGAFDPAEIFALAAQFGSAHLFAAPTMVKRMTDVARAQGLTGYGLRTVIYAGGPMYVADIQDAVDQFGPIFVQIYGQGECPMGITALSRADVADRTHPRWAERLASVGRAQSGVDVAIGDASGKVQPVGTEGEIMVQGDVVMPGYWQNPKASEQALRKGWLMTGDVGVMDAEGYVTLHDRSKDLIITGGSNVSPREVEEVLLTHPQVSEASVVGRPHAQWGEEVVAFIVGDADPEELDALCLDQIARFKRPKAYVHLTELPKNNYGKVLKTDLRARLAED